MKEKNYTHKNDVFIETTASFISWLSFDLVKFLKDNEDDHELLIKKMHLVEDRKSLLRRLNSYIVDMDIQTDEHEAYKKIDMNVRYAASCGRIALEKPLINNFTKDLRESIAQKESDLAALYSNYAVSLLQKSDPGYLYLKLEDLLEQGIYMLDPVISAKGLVKKRAIRKFTIHFKNIAELLETQIAAKTYEEFLTDECRSIEGFDEHPNNEKFLDHIIYLWTQLFNLMHGIITELVDLGERYDESGIFECLRNFEEFETQLLMNALDINRAYLYIIGYAVEKYEVLSASDHVNMASNRLQDFNVEMEVKKDTNEQDQ